MIPIFRLGEGGRLKLAGGLGKKRPFLCRKQWVSLFRFLRKNSAARSILDDYLMVQALQACFFYSRPQASPGAIHIQGLQP
jgi:hypothetical protein